MLGNVGHSVREELYKVKWRQAKGRQHGHEVEQQDREGPTIQEPRKTMEAIKVFLEQRQDVAGFTAGSVNA